MSNLYRPEIRRYTLNPDRNALIRKLGIEEDDPDSLEILDDLLAEAVALAVPRAMTRRCEVGAVSGSRVVIGDVEFESIILGNNLKEQKEVIAYVCTAGTEMDAWANGKSDMMDRFWANAINEHALGLAMRQLNRELLGETGAGLLSKMNPGSLEDWPLPQQVPLFRLVGDPETNIGVRLSESFLMIPIKSTSGIMFPTAREFINCTCCPREICPNRRAPYDPHYAAEMKVTCAADPNPCAKE
ncbi:MAG TPA: vitamin B12 dependent methionine synthase [Clostridiales bacterium]|nr:vitamin B12 dependent methionine synthase [Clostridiales bacterium]